MEVHSLSLPSPREEAVGRGRGWGEELMMRSLRSEDQRVPRARRLRRDTTDAERKLWLRLRELPMGSSRFPRQATIGPYFADFACHAKRLVIELDGGQHGEERQAAGD